MISPQPISLCTSTVETAVYRDFMEWFGGLAGDQTVTTLPQSEAFVQAVVADTTADEKRTTLSLSLTVSDKKALKMMAAERETTIAAIIHEWVQEHLEEVDE